MTLNQARQAIMSGNLRNGDGKKPVAIGRNPKDMDDCWLIYKMPPDTVEPLPMSYMGIPEYLAWSQWIGKEGA